MTATLIRKNAGNTLLSPFVLIFFNICTDSSTEQPDEELPKPHSHTDKTRYAATISCRAWANLEFIEHFSIGCKKTSSPVAIKTPYLM